MERLRAEGKEEEAQFDGGELAGADILRDPRRVRHHGGRALLRLWGW